MVRARETLSALAVAARNENVRRVELAWGAREVFPVALRFVRVDRNCKVTDKDEGAGYIVFECPPDDAGAQFPNMRKGRDEEARRRYRDVYILDTVKNAGVLVDPSIRKSDVKTPDSTPNP